jgi:serine/threonine-protein kinase
VPARVRLLREVATAVAHAHRGLVVHRDLKPGNVLVDRDGEVHLLDFGIAGLVAADGEETRTQRLALTPGYAAPEQLAGAHADTAMDVHGLGALLHRLLTGRAPPERRAPDERLPPASERVSIEAWGGAGALAAARTAIRGDLDAIVAKAIDFDPRRRYASAAGFAADLGRWLDGRPVEARAPTLRYLAGRFVRRHRGPVAAAAIAAIAVVTGSGVALWQAQRAGQAAALAQAQARIAEAESARAGAVSGFLVDLFEAGASGRPQGELPTTAELLAIGARRARGDFASQPALRADVLETIGRVYGTQDRHDEAEALLREALALRAPEDGEALARTEALLARTLSRAGRYDEAIALARTALRRLEPATSERLTARDAPIDILVSALSHAGRLGEARAVAAAHLAAVEGLGQPPATLLASALYNLATTETAQGRRAEALALLERASGLLDGVRDHWELRLSAENTRVGALSALGRHEDALARRRVQLALVREAYPSDHPRLGQTLNNFASDLVGAGLPDEALAASDEALSILGARLRPPHPTLAALHNVRGRVLLALDRIDEAQAAFVAADGALADDIGPTDRRRATIAINWADARLAGGDAVGAEALLAPVRATAEADPAALMALRWEISFGMARLAQGDVETAGRAFDAALAAAARAPVESPGLHALAHGFGAAVATAQGRDRAGVEARIAAADAEIARLEGRLDLAALRWIRERTAMRVSAGDHRLAAMDLSADLAQARAALGAEDPRVAALARQLSDLDAGH